MWAAQRCHYYVVNLLLQSGTDPLLVDGQGYNILHLATIDGNAFLLVLLLHQEIPVDVADPQGHTSLMWAAYKGFPACVDLLLRWGANVNATDEKGLNSLHWALVKGSQPCIQKIIEYGVDRFAKTTEGKTPAIVAEEMRSTRMWHRALAECGYDEDGNPKTLPLGLTSLVKDRQMMAKFFFLWPFLTLWVVISILSGMPVYAGVPISAVAAFAMQKAVAYLAQWGPSEYRHIHRTPFVTGVFAGTLFWVGIRWLFSILPTTFTSHPFFNIVFAVSYGLTTYFYFISLLEDPGYVPKLASRNSQRKVIEELLSLWKFDEENFCVQCMVRKPLRSKHCRRCGRCVAKHDQ
jgi:palmitoyltransferase ZDHHC13/17